MGSGLGLDGQPKDGTEDPIEFCLSPRETDEVLLVSAAIRDVTERKRAVAEIAAAEALFRGAFEGSPIGMALIDLDGRFTKVNEALCAITGHASRQLEGLSADAITHHDDVQLEREALVGIQAGGPPPHATDRRHIRAPH